MRTSRVHRSAALALGLGLLAAGSVAPAALAVGRPADDLPDLTITQTTSAAWSGINLIEPGQPVTYWLTVGDQVIKNTLDKRIAEIRLGLTGQIPDGLLFRISSIDNDNARGFEMQRKFAAEMMSAVPAAARKQLSGLAPAAAAS